jgi:hypothetical protein
MLQSRAEICKISRTCLCADRRVHQKRNGHKPGDHAIGNAQVGGSPPTAIQDEDLMPSERRFRDDGTKATRFYKPDDGDDRMNQNDWDIVHAGIVSKSQEIPEFRPIL